MKKKRSATAVNLAHLLSRLLVEPSDRHSPTNGPRFSSEEIEALVAADLAVRGRGDALAVTAAGRAYLQRHAVTRAGDDLDPFLAQHLDAEAVAQPPGAARRDVAESPLAWLARRKGRGGEPLIAPEQFQAGERLRAEFTHAQLMPCVTSNWSAGLASGGRGQGAAYMQLADTVIAARQRVRHALEAVGPELSGLLLDVCCFLKGLDDVERERRWPARSAKVVLLLGLDRLARHYGFERSARGRVRAPMRAWSSEQPFAKSEA